MTRKSLRAKATDWCVKAKYLKRCTSQCVENLSAKQNRKKTIQVFTTGQQTDATYVHDGVNREREALVEAARVGLKWSTLVITQSAPLCGGGSDRGGLLMSDGDEGVDLHIYTVATSSAVDKKPGITL